MVRDVEGKIMRHRNSRMKQRWPASVLLYCEKRFNSIKADGLIDDIIKGGAMDETVIA